MASNQTQIAIVGGGIAGLATAILLHRRGIRCQVFERSMELKAVGAGIQLSPNGVRVLQGMGLGPALARTAVRAGAVEIRRWNDGSLISRTPHGARCEAVFGAPYQLMHRADLQRCLVEATPPDTLRAGRECVRLVERPDAVELHFADGSVSTADLVVGADGVHSAVRGAVVTDEPRFSGYSVHRALVPAASVPSFAEDPRVVFWFGPGRHVTYYPVSGGGIVHFSAVGRAEDGRPGSGGAQAEIGQLTAAFADWHPELRRVIGAAASVTRWDLFDRDLAARYGSGRVVLVGDAAHPMLPYLSQGANQALEDSLVLADLLAGHAPARFPQAVRRYQELRHPRTAEVHAGSRNRATAFHLADGPEQRERDAALQRSQDVRQLAWLYGYRADTAAAAARPPARQHSTGEPAPIG